MLFWCWPCVFLWTKKWQVASLFSPKRVAEWKEFSTKHNTQLAKAAWQSKWSALSATSAMMCYGCAMVPVCDTPPGPTKLQVFDAKIRHFKIIDQGWLLGWNHRLEKNQSQSKIEKLHSSHIISLSWWHAHAPVWFKAPGKINISRKFWNAATPSCYINPIHTKATD